MSSLGAKLVPVERAEIGAGFETGLLVFGELREEIEASAALDLIDRDDELARNFIP